MSILITHVFVPQFIFATTNSCSDVKGTTGGVLIAYLDPNSESKVHIELSIFLTEAKSWGHKVCDWHLSGCYALFPKIKYYKWCIVITDCWL